MKSSEILLTISRDSKRFFILEKLGLDQLNRCSTASALLYIYEQGGTVLVNDMHQHFRRDKPALLSLELMTEQSTDTLGTNYKKLMSVALTDKGQKWAKRADDKLQKSYSKIPA